MIAKAVVAALALTVIVVVAAADRYDPIWQGQVTQNVYSASDYRQVEAVDGQTRVTSRNSH